MDTKQLENLWSLIVAMLFFGAIFGSLLIRPLADRLGRLRVLIVGNLFGAFGLFIGALSYFLNRFELFFLARFGIGFSLALCLGLAGIFLAECRLSWLCLNEHWGFASAWHSFWLFDGHSDCAGLLQPLVGNVHNRRNPTFCHYDTFGTFRERKSKFPFASGQRNICPWQSNEAPIERALFNIGSVVSLSMAFSGIAVINAFAVELFRATGISEYWSSIDNVGLALLIILVMNVAISGLMHAYAQTRLNWLGLCLSLAISLFVIAFAFGPGPICYFLSAELVEQNARSAAQGWANLCQMIGRTLLLVIFLPLRGSIGAGFAYFSLFVPPVLVALIFLFFYLPETKNRDFDEVRRGKCQLPRSPLKLNKAAVFFNKGSAGPKRYPAVEKPAVRLHYDLFSLSRLCGRIFPQIIKNNAAAGDRQTDGFSWQISPAAVPKTEERTDLEIGPLNLGFAKCLLVLFQIQNAGLFHWQLLISVSRKCHLK
uniref:Major facilitator superfamily (MFS) profile domain-containing protein n=1 Tax=Globodera rostochiensis TaxID=31243 RepID=A0A914IA86_GLORO